MPKLNGRGDLCSGVGGGIVAVNDVQVLPYQSGGACWVDDDTVVAQVCGVEGCWLQTYDVRTQKVTPVSARGANHIFAGGGVWAAWLGSNPATGVYTSHGMSFPTSGLGGVGPDGAVAIKVDYQSAGPWDVVERDGTRWRLTDGDVGNLNLLGGGRAVWSEPGGIIASKGLIAPLVLTVPFWWLRVIPLDDVWWTLYQDSSGRLVFHPDDGIGYLVATGNTYRPDVVRLPNRLVRVAWSVGEGEAPGQQRFVDINLSTQRIDLRVVTPPPPPPIDPVEPPKPMAFPNILSTLEAVRAQYPELITTEQAVEILNATAWKHPGFGLLAKPNGNHGRQPKTGIFCSADWLVHLPSGRGTDCFINGPSIDAGDSGEAGTQWHDEGEPFDVSRFVAPVEPTGVVTPTEPGGPAPVSTLVDTRALQAVIASLQGSVAGLMASAVGITGRLADLEARPQTGPAPLGRVALKTDNGHYLCAEDGGGGVVNATRTSAGGWETFTIEQR